MASFSSVVDIYKSCGNYDSSSEVGGSTPHLATIKSWRHAPPVRLASPSSPESGAATHLAESF